MGEYEKTYLAIHKYKMEKLFWEAKRHELESEYIRVTRALCEWEWNDREGVLVLELGGNKYKFTCDTATTQEIENHMQHEYEEYKNYINEMISECEISISECEGYLCELSRIDGE